MESILYFPLLLWSPATTVNRALQAKSESLLPLKSALIVFQVAILLLGYQLTVDALYASAGEALASPDIVRPFVLVFLVVLTSAVVLLAVRWYATALILYLVALVTGHRIPAFKTLSKLAVLSSFFWLLQQLFVLIVYLLAVQASRSVEAVPPAIGLNLMVSTVGSFQWNLLGYVNPFEIAGLAILVFGFEVATRTGRLKSFAVLSIVWLGCVTAMSAAQTLLVQWIN